MAPISLRLDRNLHNMLRDGKKRTSLNPAELIRRTLRGHLSEVIEYESREPRRITNVAPLRRGLMAKVYKEIAHEGWDEIEAKATAAQLRPSLEH